MKLYTAVQEGCGYKDTLRTHRYFALLAKYFTVCITYQLPLVSTNTAWCRIAVFVKFNIFDQGTQAPAKGQDF